jgi:hypothetical protein
VIENPPPERRDLAEQVRALASRVEHLARELTALQEELRRELRTGRVVVVEPDGFERIVLAARDRYGQITVYGRTEPGGATSAELFANDAADGDTVQAGVALTDLGDVVAVLDVRRGTEPRLWTDSRDTDHTGER